MINKNSGKIRRANLSENRNKNLGAKDYMSFLVFVQVADVPCGDSGFPANGIESINRADRKA